ncbi:MAG: hypothetical protein MIO93_06990, partial [ANME-2 cluster archaeon]|nr:hypothetical protein [ANME-2 cluster archaeon]
LWTFLILRYSHDDTNYVVCGISISDGRGENVNKNDFVFYKLSDKKALNRIQSNKSFYLCL